MKLVEVTVYLGGVWAGTAKMRWPEDVRGDLVALDDGADAWVMVETPEKRRLTAKTTLVVNDSRKTKEPE